MAANSIDLCTLDEVHSYINIRSNVTADDGLLQRLITGVSQYWLTRTGRASLNRLVDYVERYDGNDKDLMILNQFPVETISEVLVDNFSVSQSTDYLQPGWLINQNKTGVILLGTRTLFWAGRMNIRVSYQAGYASVPYDVNEAVIKQVAQMYKRKSTIDEASMIIGQGEGQTTYRNWAVPPEVEQIIQAYRRYWP